MPAKIVITRDNDPHWESGREFTRKVVTIGRSASNSLTLDDPEKWISRRHAELKKIGSEYFICDCGSSNATYLNRQPLLPHRPQLLHEGDTIKIGRYTLTCVRFYETGKGSLRLSAEAVTSDR